MGLLSRASRRAIQKTMDVDLTGVERTYAAPVGGHELLLTIGRDGASKHPVVSWRFEKSGFGGLPKEEAPVGRVAIGRDAAKTITEILQRDAKLYRPSAYTWSAGSSRAKLYKGLMSRANSDYKLQAIPRIPWQNRLSDVIGSTENIFNAGKHVPLKERLRPLDESLYELFYPQTDLFQAVYSPSLKKELLEGMAINAPLAGLGAAALGYGR